MNYSVCRSGRGLLRFLVCVVLMAMLIAVGVGAWANYDEDHDGDGKPDGLTFHVLDPVWWGVARDDLKPVLKKVKTKALAMREELWADGGMVDQAQDFLEASKQGRDAAKQAGLIEESVPNVGNRSQAVAQREREPEETPSAAVSTGAQGDLPAGAGEALASETDVLKPLSANPITDLKQAPTLHLEDNIADASEYFAAGLVAYRLAKPAADELTPAGEQKLFQAQVHFRSVRALLNGTVEEYALRPDYDADLLEFGQGLLERTNGLLLESM